MNGELGGSSNDTPVAKKSGERIPMVPLSLVFCCDMFAVFKNTQKAAVPQFSEKFARIRYQL